MTNKIQIIFNLLKKKKCFFELHPEVYSFLKNELGQDFNKGDEISVYIKVNDKENYSISVKLEESDIEFIRTINDLFKD